MISGGGGIFIYKKLLGAKGIAARSKKLLGAPGITTWSKKLLVRELGKIVRSLWVDTRLGISVHSVAQ